MVGAVATVGILEIELELDVLVVVVVVVVMVVNCFPARFPSAGDSAGCLLVTVVAVVELPVPMVAGGTGTPSTAAAVEDTGGGAVDLGDVAVASASVAVDRL